MLVPLTNVSALAFIFACTMVSFSCYKMRLTEPDLPRPYKVPYGKFGISLACLAGSLIVLLMVVPGKPQPTLNADRMEYRFGMAGYRPDYQNFAPK